jgi:hypothetical protein
MKRFLKIMMNILALALCCACLFSCSDTGRTDGGDKGGEIHTVTGVVTNMKNDIKICVSLDNDYIVKVTPDTVIVDAEGKTIVKEDIKIGVEIKVTYNGMATRSIPPQIVAEKIIVGAFIAEEASSMEENYIMTARVKSLGDKLIVDVVDSPIAEGEYAVNTSPSTKISGAGSSLSDIAVGDLIEITYTGQVMLSLPPQIIALEIVIK